MSVIWVTFLLSDDRMADTTGCNIAITLKIPRLGNPPVSDTWSSPRLSARSSSSYYAIPAKHAHVVSPDEPLWLALHPAP